MWGETDGWEKRKIAEGRQKGECEGERKSEARRGSFPSLGGHRLRKKAAGLEKDEESAPDLVLRGGRGCGREGNGRRGRRGGVRLRICENKTRVVIIGTLRVGRRPRMRREKKTGGSGFFWVFRGSLSESFIFEDVAQSFHSGRFCSKISWKIKIRLLYFGEYRSRFFNAQLIFEQSWPECPEKKLSLDIR